MDFIHNERTRICVPTVRLENIYLSDNQEVHDIDI
jgi:hypothetical protein